MLSMARTYRIGTRGSKLAMRQAEIVAETLQAKFPDFSYELIVIKTTGDKFMGDLSKVGGKGAFVKEIEDAMLKNEIDLAMHSMKDVPNELPETLVIPCILDREDIRDAVVCREGESFEGLPEGAIVGTSSLRRASQIRRNFPHLTIKPCRGNIHTRIDKLNNKEFDALILAKAGLDRVGLSNKIDLVFEPDMMLPAVGQGAIGVECREDDAEALSLLSAVNSTETTACLDAEREMARLLGGNCHTPIAGYCVVTKGNNLRLIAHVTSVDGKTLVRSREKMDFENAIDLGRVVAEDLLSQGAQEIIDSIKAE